MSRICKQASMLRTGNQGDVSHPPPLQPLKLQGSSPLSTRLLGGPGREGSKLASSFSM